MTLWSRTRTWIRDFLQLSRTESEMQAELRSHIEAFAWTWFAAAFLAGGSF
jgi:hypothetical protein